MNSFFYKFLLIVFTLFLVSCASYTKNFAEKEKTVKKFTPGYLNNFQEASFKISIDAFGNHFDGILAAKKLEINHFRFAVVNEFGAKLLDFELKNNELKLNYAIDELNQKMLLKLLEKDFNLIFSENNQVENQFQNDRFHILECSVSNLRKPVYYFLDSETGKPDKIVLANRTEDVLVSLVSTEKVWPEFEISHQKLPIKIYLHLLEI